MKKIRDIENGNKNKKSKPNSQISKLFQNNYQVTRDIIQKSKMNG